MPGRARRTADRRVARRRRQRDSKCAKKCAQKHGQRPIKGRLRAGGSPSDHRTRYAVGMATTPPKGNKDALETLVERLVDDEDVTDHFAAREELGSLSAERRAAVTEA